MQRIHRMTGAFLLLLAHSGAEGDVSQRAEAEVFPVKLTSRGPLEIRRVKRPKGPFRRWQRVEFEVALSATYDNPFDPDEVSLDLHVQAPGGEAQIVHGFFAQDFERRLIDENGGPAEELTQVGEPRWLARYVPARPGRHRYWLAARDRTGETRTKARSFAVRDGPGRGFVRVRAGSRYFTFDDGSSFFPIGHNVCWPGSRGTFDYDHYFRRMAEAGENYGRLWLGPFDAFTLERVRAGEEDYCGLGVYDLANAWRIDRVIQEAEKRGIYLMLCIESFNSLRSRPKYDYWHRNPYNAANGGPCARPEDFFTSAEARSVFKRRLRYLVARCAASTSVLSWELWNEVNIVDRYASEPVAAWHEEMSRYIRDADPYNHLITTSYVGFYDPAVFGQPGIDYVQSHHYGGDDLAGAIVRGQRRMWEQYHKPHYFGEVGISHSGRETGQRDPLGAHLHNAIWASAFSGAAGTAMSWWWDSYIEPKDLYRRFTGLARFCEGVEWADEGFEPIPEADVAAPSGLRVIGLRGAETTLIWAQNRAHTWRSATNRVSVEPAPPSEVSLSGVRPGRYAVERYDTETGLAVESATVETGTGPLRIRVPAVAEDVAYKIRALGDE
ncbi:MAG: cellulase family glycosylhydrolase [Armatimonadota bacterium]